jgi:hypothetical protein
MFPLRSHLIERSVAIVCVSIYLGVAVAQSLSLERNKAIEREIGAGETHSFTLNLTAGQYAHVVVDQRGVDVVVSIFAPNGTKVAQVDMPNGNSGPEPVSLMAETTGAYRVDVLSTSTKLPGRYEVKLDDVHAATESDRKRISGQELFTEAKALRYRRTKECYQQATEKYTNIGWVFGELDDTQNLEPVDFQANRALATSAELGQYRIIHARSNQQHAS